MTIITTFYKLYLRLLLSIITLIFPFLAYTQLPCGGAIDFNTWSVGGVAANGNWIVNPGGTSVEQTINGQPTWFLSPDDFINVIIQGSIEVNTNIDDDLVGFVFGYQNPIGVMANPASTYTKSFFFDWKQGTQVYQGMTSNEGFALFEVDGLYNYTQPFFNDYWQRVNTPLMTIIDTDYGNNGWNNFQQYDFQLKYTSDSIVIWIDGTRIFEEDGCFEPGKFGFYNFSQSFVTYSNFSYTMEYDFDVSDTLICIGDTSFFEIASGCNNQIPQSINFSWDFGDGNGDAGTSPFHIYSAPGSYQVEMISVDPAGCSDTSVQIVDVMGYPVPTAGADEISCGLSYTLNANPSTGQWFALNGGVFSDVTSPNSTVTVPSMGTYDFVWEETNVAGCSNTDTVSITFNDLSMVAVLTDPSCNGGSNGDILVTGSGGSVPLSYQWDAAAANQITGQATNLSAGSYTLTLTDAAGCTMDSTFSLSEPLPLTYSLNLVPSDCDFDDGSATISNMSGGTAPYSFDWGGGVVTDNFVNGIGSGTYFVTVYDDEGCDSTFSFDILNDPFIVSANVVNDVSCFGFNDGQAIAVGPNVLATYTYQWGSSSNNQTTETATNLIPGNHDVTITSSGGCSETTSVIIQEPTPLAVAVMDLSLCGGDLFTLTAVASGATPNYTYSWVNSSGLVQNPVDITVSQTETYTVTATDANGCTLQEDLTVTMLETPEASFMVDINESCLRPSQSFSFQNTSIPAGGTMDWDFGDGNTATGNFVNHSYSAPGTYSVGLNVTSPNGCSDSHLEPNFITIHPNPIADFTFSPGSVTTLNSIVQFIDLSVGTIASWDWEIGDHETSTSQNPVYDFESITGAQHIHLDVVNVHGCLDSTSRIIEINNEITIFAPNAFTPDGDEFNQTWRMHLSGLDLYSVEINIYNRWGEKVWQSFDVDVPWDGTYNGVIVQDGTYIWTLSARDLNTDKKIERTGHVNVLR